MKGAYKPRSDIALTLEIVDAIVERIKSGEPITRRGCSYLLLDYLPSQEKVPVSTYTSWLRRGTIPLGSKDGYTLQDLVEEAREAYREEFKKDMVRRAEGVFSDGLNMVISQPAVLKRINESGKIEQYNGRVIIPKVAEVRQRVAEFVVRKLDPKTYGDSTKIQFTSGFNLPELRRAKERHDVLLRLKEEVIQ